MNIAKHMEVIFIVAAVLLCTATAVAAEHMAPAAALMQTQIQMPVRALAVDDGIAVVTVTARRLTAEEKAAPPL